jgi:hypothetical protein
MYLTFIQYDYTVRLCISAIIKPEYWFMKRARLARPFLTHGGYKEQDWQGLSLLTVGIKSKIGKAFPYPRWV